MLRERTKASDGGYSVEIEPDETSLRGGIRQRLGDALRGRPLICWVYLEGPIRQTII
ncbi:hypothetical protein LCGC14_1678990 [marine sediment metagenome]|uniref:Uncharacterized protein n=1 Tax=marine sediment metagenome TaxID=412755 RepID=A0A0F9KP70_9ZZZZ